MWTPHTSIYQWAWWPNEGDRVTFYSCTGKNVNGRRVYESKTCFDGDREVVRGTDIHSANGVQSLNCMRWLGTLANQHRGSGQYFAGIQPISFHSL